MKYYLMAVAVGGLFAGSAIASTSPTAYAGHELASQAKITMAQARANALKARPGRIVDQELENEGGGSRLRYSFDIVSHGKTIEVGIDAMTGTVLENGAESKGKEAKEAVLEQKAKH
jgi:uncharacterized membrane protein YkoI